MKMLVREADGRSLVTYGTSFSRPFHGLGRENPRPSDESLGYYHPSAKTRTGTKLQGLAPEAQQVFDFDAGKF